MTRKARNVTRSPSTTTLGPSKAVCPPAAGIPAVSSRKNFRTRRSGNCAVVGLQWPTLCQSLYTPWPARLWHQQSTGRPQTVLLMTSTTGPAQVVPILSTKSRALIRSTPWEAVGGATKAMHPVSRFMPWAATLAQTTTPTTSSKSRALIQSTPWVAVGRATKAMHPVSRVTPGAATLAWTTPATAQTLTTRRPASA